MATSGLIEPTYSVALPEKANTPELAFNEYFSLLNEGNYKEAMYYHGAGYETLYAWNGGVSPADRITLFKNGCEMNGWQCLKVKKILKTEKISDTETKFTVQFQNNDGSLFERGPCCGSTEEQDPTQREFTYNVKKTKNGFMVMNEPLYVP